jgi:hypothetical protein
MPVVASDVERKVMDFAFGEVHLRFETSDPGVVNGLERRYGAFPSEIQSPDFTVRFESTTAKLPDGLEAPLAVWVEKLDCDRTAAGYRIRTPTTFSEVDLAERCARVRGPSAMYPLDNVLRHLLPLLWDEGVIVHAAAFASRDGRGWLASGPSGAGKSTLAELAGESALSDELVSVRVDEERSVLVSLPFWQARPGSVDLHAILMLRHGERNRVDRLRPEAAFRELSTQILWPVWDEAAMSRSFDFLVRIVERTPAFVFAFRPDTDIFEFLEREVL